MIDNTSFFYIKAVPGGKKRALDAIDSKQKFQAKFQQLLGEAPILFSSLASCNDLFINL